MNNTQQHNLPLEILKWLTWRCITEEVLIQSRISWDGYRIVIPVFDEKGNFLFNKYRRDPFIKSQLPKYTYDAGATASLYNVQKGIISPLIITESELCCLTANSLGLPAISSTGGAGVFRQQWADMLVDHAVYLCLDSDFAGIKGMIKIQQMLPNARWIALPEDTKDFTEFIQKRGVKDFVELMKNSVPYTIPQYDAMIGIKKSELKSQNDAFKRAVNKIVKIQEKDKRPHLEYIRKFLLEKYINTQIHENAPVRAGDLAEVKQIPITNYIKFNRSGFAKCLWHNEKDASLKYYGPKAARPNTVHCFGSCQRSYDVIDVIMQLENVNFTEALKILKGL